MIPHFQSPAMSAPMSFFSDLPTPGSMITRFFSGAGAGGEKTQPERPGISGVHVSAPPAATSAGIGTHLVRHSSSPAGFLSQVLVDHALNCETGGYGNYSQLGTYAGHSFDNSRSTSPWKFSELSIPETSENMSSNTHSIVFSAPKKRAKDNNANIVRSISNIETQFNLTVNSADYHQLQPDSVLCKVRAKRGSATHPRSIAERDRRTRISNKLRKLQDVVPNVDKQISTSDMLELAVKHIKELQDQLQLLKQEEEKCTCGCNRSNVRLHV